MQDPLNPEERSIVADLGRIYARIAAITGNDVTREADLAEITGHVHALQHAVMAQAVARVFPGEFRLLGELCGDATEDDSLVYAAEPRDDNRPEGTGT